MKVEFEISAFRVISITIAAVILYVVTNTSFLSNVMKTAARQQDVILESDHQQRNLLTEQHVTHALKHGGAHGSGASAHAFRSGGHGHGASYQCTKEEKLFQHAYMDLVHFDICSEAAWDFAQFLYPDANVFFDIGANRGYTAARFFGLWSPGSEINRQKLYRKYEDAKGLNILKNNEQINTFCDDAGHQDQQLFCAGRRHRDTNCFQRRNMTVYSFDGQKTHYEDAQTVMKKYFPHLQPDYKPNPHHTKTKATWHYNHMAVTDVYDKETPTGYFLVVTHETGKLVKKKKGEPMPVDHIEVPITTVDHFCTENKIDKVDFLKIDAEGADMDVLRGANHTIRHRQVKMISFECFSCLSKEYMPMVDALNHEFGFDCYLMGWSNLAARVTNCMEESLYIGQYGLNTIMHCVKRHSLIHYALENFSLLRHMNNKRGDIKLDGVVHNDSAIVVNGELRPN